MWAITHWDFSVFVLLINFSVVRWTFLKEATPPEESTLQT